MTTQTTSYPRIVSRGEWLQAREALLAKEKEHTQQRDALSAARRELPWVKVDKQYVFNAASGKKTLADLFEGRSQLVVYHLMSKSVGAPGPDGDDSCPTCSIVADHINAGFVHLGQRDVTLLAVSRNPVARIEALKARMEWDFDWVSSLGNDFNHDYRVTVTKEEMAGGKVNYNYQERGWEEYPAEDKHGLSVFFKSADGQVFHTYSVYSRGCEDLLGIYTYLDLVPKGRDESLLPFPMAWMRHHDRYAESLT
jgi:predicted dithiol-disulfide oxidoreductase (DUF899 family)